MCFTFFIFLFCSLHSSIYFFFVFLQYFLLTYYTVVFRRDSGAPRYVVNYGYYFAGGAEEATASQKYQKKAVSYKRTADCRVFGIKSLDAGQLIGFFFFLREYLFLLCAGTFMFS